MGLLRLLAVIEHNTTPLVWVTLLIGVAMLAATIYIHSSTPWWRPSWRDLRTIFGLVLLVLHPGLVVVSGFGTRWAGKERISAAFDLPDPSSKTTNTAGILIIRSGRTESQPYSVQRRVVPFKRPVVRGHRIEEEMLDIDVGEIEALEFKQSLGGGRGLWTVVGHRENGHEVPAFLASADTKDLRIQDAAGHLLDVPAELSFAEPVNVNGVEAMGGTIRYVYFDGRCGMAEQDKSRPFLHTLGTLSLDGAPLPPSGWQGVASVPKGAAPILLPSPSQSSANSRSATPATYIVTNGSAQRIYVVRWELNRITPLHSISLNDITGPDGKIHYFEGAAIIGNNPYWLAVADAYQGVVYLRELGTNKRSVLSCSASENGERPSPLYVEGIAARNDQMFVTSRHGRVVPFHLDKGSWWARWVLGRRDTVWKRGEPVDLDGVEHMQDGSYGDGKIFVGNEESISAYSEFALSGWGAAAMYVRKAQESLACILVLIDLLFIQAAEGSLWHRAKARLRARGKGPPRAPLAHPN